MREASGEKLRAPAAARFLSSPRRVLGDGKEVSGRFNARPCVQRDLPHPFGVSKGRGAEEKAPHESREGATPPHRRARRSLALPLLFLSLPSHR